MDGLGVELVELCGDWCCEVVGVFEHVHACVRKRCFVVVDGGATC